MHQMLILQIFFNELRLPLQNYKADLICGDFNLELDPLVDTFIYKHINNKILDKLSLRFVTFVIITM